jgi:hypothetical protein
VSNLSDLLKRNASKSGKSGSFASQRRDELREELWPGSRKQIWHRHDHKGFGTIPRLLPLVLHLIKRLSKKGNPADVYLQLWARNFDEGFIEVTDELALAFEAGYDSTRALRTWRDHIFKLEKLGFIKIQPAGIRPIAYILLLNPLDVCARLKKDGSKAVSPEWWNAFLKRAKEIGAVIPAGATSEGGQHEKSIEAPAADPKRRGRNTPRS